MYDLTIICNLAYVVKKRIEHKHRLYLVSSVQGFRFNCVTESAQSLSAAAKCLKIWFKWCGEAKQTWHI